VVRRVEELGRGPPLGALPLAVIVFVRPTGGKRQQLLRLAALAVCARGTRRRLRGTAIPVGVRVSSRVALIG
jgi:hypothetical protein